MTQKMFLHGLATLLTVVPFWLLFGKDDLVTLPDSIKMMVSYLVTILVGIYWYRLPSKVVGDEVKVHSQYILIGPIVPFHAEYLRYQKFEYYSIKIFLTIKAENERKISALEAKLIEISEATINIQPVLDKAVGILSRIGELYKDGDVRTKRSIIGSIYPEKLSFDGFQYRTNRLNEAVRIIYSLDKAFNENKTGQIKENFDLSY
jgi:hypothetical protein